LAPAAPVRFIFDQLGFRARPSAAHISYRRQCCRKIQPFVHLFQQISIPADASPNPAGSHVRMIQSWYCSFKNLKTSDFVAGEVCQKRDECLVKMPPSAGAGRC
jgi:hypothetical protein